MQAQKTGVATEPVRQILGQQNIQTAYKVQHLISQLRRDHGAIKIGSKIGLTSKAVQNQLGVDQPDYGSLFNDMQIRAGDTLAFNDLMQPKAEAEIAFVLKNDLDSEDLNLNDIAHAIDYAVAAIEIVGSRVKDWDIKITDTIADNASASHFILGTNRKALDEIDLINCKMRLYKNQELVSEGFGHNCLGNPLEAALWLAKTMREHGDPLRAGEIILSGALGPMCNLEKGDHLNAEIEGLGTVELNIGL
ncbi:MAG: fumarylacetoacetate hydrolase family protein [Bacteroidia bacterium]